MCFIRLCPLPWRQLSVLPWCPPSILFSNELSPCLLKGVLESWFYINSMFGRDVHIYAYHWHLVWLHALNLSSVLYYMFMREGDWVKPWSSVHLLAIRSSLVTLCCFTFSTWWQQLYSLKCHSLGLQAQSDVAREVSPQGDSGLLSNSRRSLRLVPFPRSSNNLQQWTNNFASPINCGSCQAQTACKINKTEGNSENMVFGDFQV
jgi:hypothetical protein